MAHSNTERSAGVRTFLIADVRGYTRFTLEQGDEAAARLAARFADVVEDAAERHDGEVLELRGDEALAAFQSPRAALRAALEVQERFAREREQSPSLPLLVGIGLDAGEAVPLKGGFRGGALNLAARLCSLAAAGEVLASEGVIHLARKTEGVRYLDRGSVQLKGFAEPVRVIRVLPATEDTEVESASGPAEGFRLSVMGRFQLTYNGTELETLSWQPRARTLFTIIATSPQMRRSRDDLIDLLWPDATPEAGASNLRYTVHLLRRALGEIDPTPLLTHGGWIELNPAHAWEIDLHRFEALASRRDNPVALQEGATLYGGEVLSEYRYEDWATPIRERIQRLWRELCFRLAQLDQEQGDLENAARWYERLLESDRLDEEAVQHLLPLLAQSGRDTDALRIYTQFASRLREELDVEPAAETVALIEQLRLHRTMEPVALPVNISMSSGSAVALRPTYPLPTPGRLAGRSEELQRINTLLLSGARDSLLRLLLVSAEAGMGKTRLLAEVAELAYGADMLVLAGGCYEEEGHLPWGPIHDALLDYVRVQPEHLLRRQLDDLLPALAQIVPEIRARLPDIPEMAVGDADAQRLRLFSTVTGVLERIARDRPLLLILDDLHWADEVTLQVLHFLVRQPGLEGVHVLAAYRSDEVRHDSPLEGLQARVGVGGTVDSVILKPLSEHDLSTLVEDRLAGECAEHLVRGLRQRSAGNPFFTLQMVRLLEQEGGLHRDQERWELTAGTHIDLPPAVRDTVGRRLRHLDASVRTVLSLGSVLGREFDYAPLESMTTDSEESLFEALDQAQEAGLVRESGDGYAFTHPLLWEVIYGRIPDQRRRRLHDQAGRSLEELYGAGMTERPAELAWHFVESGNRARALHYTLQAGKQAEGSIAFAEAERYFRQAIGLARSLGDQEHLAQALEGLGGVLRAEARLPEAIELLDEAAHIQEALGDLDAEARVVAQLGLAWYFAPGGITPEHAHRLRGTIRRVEARDGEHPSLALGQLAAALPRLLAYEPAEELIAARQATDLGRLLGEPSLEAAGYLRQGSGLLGHFQFEESLNALSQAVTLAEQAGDLFTMAAACNFAANASLRLGHSTLALEYSTRAFKAVEARGGLEQMLGVSEGAHARSFVLGEWDLANQFARRHIALIRSLRGEEDIAVPYLHLAEISIHRGEWEEADSHLARAGASVDLSDPWRLSIQTLLAEQALLQGNVEVALRHIRAAPEPRGEDWQSDLDIPKALVLGAAGDQAAEQAARRALNDADQRQHPVSRMEALHAMGVALRSVQNYTEAVATLQTAIELAHALPYPFLQGRALYELGLILTATDKPREAQLRFEEALTLFQRLWARPYVEQTEAALTECEQLI